MANKDFEKIVLEEFSKINNRFDGLENKFDNLENRFDGLENEVSGLRKEMHNGFDRLENLINDQTEELSERIDNQGKYLDQAFGLISSMQAERLQNNFNRTRQKYGVA